MRRRRRRSGSRFRVHAMRLLINLFQLEFLRLASFCAADAAACLSLLTPSSQRRLLTLLGNHPRGGDARQDGEEQKKKRACVIGPFI